MTEKEQRLAAYARRVSASAADESPLRTPEQPTIQQESAAGALRNARDDRAFGPGQATALEAVVHKEFRPALLVRGNIFDLPPAPWLHLEALRQPFKPLLEAIGRVEVAGSSLPFCGTGFLVGDGLMLTNRHVAEVFTSGVGASTRLNFLPDRVASMNTGREVVPAAGVTFKVVKVLLVHPHWDAALLRVEPERPDALVPAPLPLCAAAPRQLADREVVVAGYPYWSDFHEAAVLQQIFGGILGVKRLQPGKLMRIEALGSYGHTVDALLHDASTLGGNSGSAVIDVATRQVLALHFAGSYLVTNYSVPMWELARDPRMVDAGLNFQRPSDEPAPGDGETIAEAPAWLSAWTGREEVPAPAASPGTDQPAAVPAAPGIIRATVLDPGWFERYSDEELRRLYQRDPDGFRVLLAASFSAREAQEIYDTVLFDASVEGMAERAAADPSLPEIVLLPGILGSNLRSAGRLRAWLDLLMLPVTNFLSSLGLDTNGNDPNSLLPDGYIQTSYRQAARAWRSQGFTVHEFSYDWRKPLAKAAQGLDAFLRARRHARREARFALVCHSMGGLVASVWARDFGEWRDYADHAILCGSPLGGSFAIMEILTGEYPTVRKLAALSLRTSLNEMRQMGASFPGALEMLPHPALFSRPGADVERLYRGESYAAFARPGADWLRAARRIKDHLRDSPLLGRAQAFVCVDRPTAGSFALVGEEVRHSPFTVRGDGTVPAASALVPGVTAYRVTHEHSELLHDPAVIESVPQLLAGQGLALDQVDEAALRKPLIETAAAPPLEGLQAKWEAEAVPVRERLRRGVATADDVRWILSAQ